MAQNSSYSQKGKRFHNFMVALQLGWFLAYRQLKRSSKATTALIIFVMTLTFLNLIVVRGVLVGLIQGVTNVYDDFYSGEIIISNLDKRDYIENSPSVLAKVAALPWVESYSARYLEGGTIEAGYKERINLTDDPNSASGVIAGIDPVAENRTTGLSAKIVEGEFLTVADTEAVVLGATLLKKYVPIDSASFALLEDVAIGDKLRLTVNGNTREVTLKGIIQSKADDVDLRIYMLDNVLRTLIGRTDYNVDEIAINLIPGADPNIAKQALVKSGVEAVARVRTAEEALPKFVVDIKNTFALLGNVVGSIGLVVASITIFIVIFVNAITRRKFIGIMKGIGINARAIEIAYVFQSVFYAVIGIGLGMALLYGVMVPFVDAHPIKFPFSDGVLVAEYSATFFRAGLLILATVVAGFIPARIVVKQNTLDAILGR